MKIKYAPHPLLAGYSDASIDHWLDGTIANGGVQKPNGKFLSVQPDGSYQERDAVGGPYEQLAPAADLNVLVVKPATTFKIPYIVTAL